MNSPQTTSAPARQTDRLESWKEIATYMNRGERTVRRWEQTEGLPVHRHLHNKRSTVYALRPELDDWLEARGGVTPIDTVAEESAPVAALEPAPVVRGADRRFVAAAAIVTLALAGGLAFRWMGRSPAEVKQYRSTPLTAYPGSEMFASYSPDGSRLAFSWNGPADAANAFDIYVKPVPSGEPKRISAPRGVNLGAEWSPDGTRLAWFRYESGSRGRIVVAPATGEGPEIELTQSLAPLWNLWQRMLSWSPDGEWIVFSDRDGDQGPAAVWAISARTRERRRLTSPDAAVMADDSPIISFDGSQLAFFRKRSRFRGDLYLQGLGPGLQLAGQPERCGNLNTMGGGLAWLPDGQGLLLPTSRGFSFGILQIGIGGDVQPFPIPAVHGGTVLPSMSRAGRLVLTEHQDDADLQRFPTAGGGDPLAMRLSTRHDGHPRLAPDGTRIAYMSNRSGSFDLWVVEADGSNARQLTSDGSYNGYGAWSPDSRTIVFNSNRSGQMQVYTIGIGDTEPRQLTQDAADHLFPFYSADGRSVYFSANRGGIFQIHRIPAEGGAVEPVTRGGAIAGRATPDGRSIVFARDALLSTSLWELRLDQPEAKERLLAPAVAGFVNFDIAGNSVVYAPFPARDGGWSIQQMDLGSGQNRQLRSIAPGERLFGLTANRTAEWIVLARSAHQRTDLIGVEPVR